jgi:hypothetical protein
MPKTPNGAVLYRGPSAIDGAPIVVIATGFANSTDNTKTGDMIQTWVMRSDVAPQIAVKDGRDSSVCGDCNLRPSKTRAKGRKPCYVRVWQAPRSVYGAFTRGRYPDVTPTQARKLCAGRKLRLGSYGNPSAAPFDTWQEIATDTTGRTGYIHNWRTADSKWSALVMASVESYDEAIEARKLGYRLFRVNQGAEPKLPGEVSCPASKESGHKTTCSACVACGGHSSKARADIVINAH